MKQSQRSKYLTRSFTTGSATRSTARIFTILCLALALTACSDPLHKAAVAIEGVADANNSVTQTVIQANGSGIISDADAGVILNQICKKVAEANLIANDLTLKYATSPPPPELRPRLLALLDPVVQALQTALSQNLTNIKNPDTQTNIRNGLITVRSGLLIAQAALQ